MLHVPRHLKIVAEGSALLSEKQKPFSDAIIEATGKERPRVLLVPTAKPTDEEIATYAKKFTEHFGNLLGVETAVLHDSLRTPPSKTAIDHEIGSADALFISGGNTRQMINAWKDWGVDTAIATAADRGVVLSGGSAGAIAWFNRGHSDSLSYEVAKDEPWEYIFTPGLGLVRATVCPHYDSKTGDGELRRTNYARLLRESPPAEGELALGITNRAAFVALEGTVSVIRIEPDANVYSIDPTTGQESVFEA